MATTDPIASEDAFFATKYSIKAELSRFSELGLKPVGAGDLSGRVNVRYINQPAMLINTRAHVSVLASAAAASAQRLAKMLNLLQFCPEEGIDEQTFESLACMADEAAALAVAAAEHPTVKGYAELDEAAS